MSFQNGSIPPPNLTANQPRIRRRQRKSPSSISIDPVNDTGASNNDDGAPEVIIDDDDDEMSDHETSSLTKREKIYLIDMDNVPNTLQTVIETEDINHTMVYCFCGSNSPKISLGLLNEYSRWVLLKRLKIIEIQTKCERPTDFTIGFWAGKLAATHSKDDVCFFVASDNYDLQTVAESLQQHGFETQTSWPPIESIQCTNDIMYVVLSFLDKTAMQSRPTTLLELQNALQTDFGIPAYISAESVIRMLIDHSFVSVHKGRIRYTLPTFVEQVTGAANATIPAENRRRRTQRQKNSQPQYNERQSHHHPGHPSGRYTREMGRQN